MPTRPGGQVGPFALSILPELLAICQASCGVPVPHPLPGLRFWSLTCADDEWSAVLPADSVPAGWKADRGWRGLKILGPLDLTLVGVLADLSSTLAQAAISVFAISTYETDYILVHDADLERAVAALRERGYQVS
jgi:hypothetical protein